MTTFELADVREFAVGLRNQIERCDNGEGMECENLDATLKHYAEICCQMRQGIREWGQAVFSGKIAFDREVETEFIADAVSLYAHARALEEFGEDAEDGPCWILDGQCALCAALWELGNLLHNWVSPQLAVAPSARQGRQIDAPVRDAILERVKALPPLAAGWQPQLPSQKRLFRKLKAR